MRFLKAVTRLLLFACACLPAARAADSFVLGPLEAPPATLRSGWLVVPRREDGEARIPVSVLHGARPGPVLALIAGTHGYEYPPITALQRLRRRDRRRGAGIPLRDLPPGARRVHAGNAHRPRRARRQGRRNGPRRRPRRALASPVPPRALSRSDAQIAQRTFSATFDRAMCQRAGGESTSWLVERLQSSSSRQP